MSHPARFWAAACLLLLGCEGAITSDGVHVLSFDGGQSVDLAVNPDARPPDPDDGVFVPDPDAGPLDPDMAALDPDGAMPDAAQLDPDAAPPPPPPDAGPPGDPTGRSEEQVCARWTRDHVPTQGPDYLADDPNDACDHGSVPAAAQENGIRRTNLYRWLAGLGPVGLDAALRPQQQACAALQAAMGRLSHQPPQNAPCYTREGAAGAGSSNLAGGRALADTVDAYVADNNTPSLGHRRWVLNPSARVTTFGHKGRWGCQYSFSQGGPVEVDYVSWPPAGPVPVSAAPGPFHVSLYRIRPAQNFEIHVALDDGAFERVDLTPLAGGFGGGVPAYVFALPAGERLGNVWSAGRRLRVSMRNLRDHEDVAFTTRFVACR